MEFWFKYGVGLQSDTQCTCNLILRSFQVAIVAVENWLLLKILIDCLHPFDIQHANLMRRIIFSSVACITLHYLLHCLKYGNIPKTIEKITCFLISVLIVLETLLILRKTDDIL
jgi:hypothetical protein